MADDKNGDGDNKELYRSLGFLSTIGITLVAATFLGFGIGYYIDKYLAKWFSLHTKPVFTIIFTIFGVIAGFKNIFELTRDNK